MTKFSLVLLDDVRELDFEKDSLSTLCYGNSETSFAVYKSPIYINGTGYVKTVKEEISLVLQGYQLHRKNYLDFDQFVKKWHFCKFLDYDITGLSGGWKKFLGLALFTNQVSQGKIFFDATRHLSDELIGVFLSNLRETDTFTSFFFEYDISYLPIHQYDFQLLLKGQAELTPVNFEVRSTDIGTEANYDWDMFR